jgi:protein-S-isoprenylcysteine O-methyltransferase Ste14
VTRRFAISLVWLVWWISWRVAAAWSDRAIKRAGLAHQIPYRLMRIVGIILLFGIYPHGSFQEFPLWQVGRNIAWGMVILAVLGFLFAWWARVYLGRLWSLGVTRKADHRVIDTGPYALVRHPIYTGVILAALATAIVRGTAMACLGATLMIVGWCIKAQLEERFLREQLGPGLYAAYADRVPMVVPFLRF